MNRARISEPGNAPLQALAGQRALLDIVLSGAAARSAGTGEIRAVIHDGFRSRSLSNALVSASRGPRERQLQYPMAFRFVGRLDVARSNIPSTNPSAP